MTKRKPPPEPTAAQALEYERNMTIAMQKRGEITKEQLKFVLKQIDDDIRRVKC